MNLKGHVCIDLRNHKSGFTERIEGNNTITDALNNYIKYGIVTNSLFNSYIGDMIPIATGALGGLCLLDTAFSGNGDIFIPPTAQTIGMGSYNFSDTNSKYIGAYNQLESGWNESTHTYTHIYDFTTSQANGTINAVGLTSGLGGKGVYMPVFNYSYRYFQLSGGYILFIDYENNDIYYTKEMGENKHVYKIRYVFDGFTLNSSGNIISASQGVDTGKTISYVENHLWYDGGDGNIYQPYLYNSNDTMHIKVVDKDTFVEDTEIVCTFPSNIQIFDGVGVDMTNGYIYAMSSDGTYLYRYDLSNETIGTYTASQMFGTGYEFEGHITTYPNGGVCGLCKDSSSHRYIFRISSSGKLDFEPVMNAEEGFKDMNAPYHIAPNGTLYIEDTIYGYTGIYVLENVLMSNYNLQSSITKTNAQSMRITYNIAQV